MDDKRYASALAAAAASTANLGGSPNGNDATMQHLQNLAQLKFAAGVSGLAQGAFGGAAKQQADDEDAKRKAAEQAADNAAKKQAAATADKEAWDKEMNDPANFKRVAAQDGGYDFYDPAGRKINMQTYAAAKGIRPDEALKDSGNPNDTDFTNNYNKTVELGRVMATGDKSSLDKFLKSNPDVKNNIDQLGIKSYADYVKNFRQAYTPYFTQSESQGIQQQANNVPNNMQLSGGSSGGLVGWLKNLFGG